MIPISSAMGWFVLCLVHHQSHKWRCHAICKPLNSFPSDTVFVLVAVGGSNMRCGCVKK